MQDSLLHVLLQVIMFFVCGMFLAIRGATGCVAIYLPYQQYWAQDKYYYPLDALPEYIVLVILSWPGFLARMAQSWPKSPQMKDKYRDKSQHRQSDE